MDLPQYVCIGLGVVGAICGAGLESITGFAAFGPSTFYVAGALVSLGFLIGALLANSLTRRERRV